MRMPAASVIMPVYNRERFVMDAVTSVLQQTHTDVELIIVDDGSTDRTPELIASLRDPRVRTFRQPHRGISAAMNAGLRANIVAIKPVAYRNLWVGVGLVWLIQRQTRRAAVAYGRAIRDGGNPLATLVRIAWFTLSWRVLGKFGLGRRFVARQASGRTRWQAGRPDGGWRGVT